MLINDCFKIKVIGDSGPFSKTGRSICYLIEVGESSYLVDIGSPVFQLLSFPQLNAINGIAITHPHDDHKRWYSDFLLYRKYVTPNQPKMKLLTGWLLINDIKRSSRAALEKTLSFDSEKVVECAYENFVDQRPISPQPKYTVKKIYQNNTLEFRVKNEDGKILTPDKAKVIIHPVTGSRSILFFDEEYRQWINPETFYSFSDTTYYNEIIPFIDEKSGLKISAVNAATWHGINAVSFIFEYDNTKIYFSGDTVYNSKLWLKFMESELTPKTDLTTPQFINAYSIIDDINNYIQRTWSQRRFKEAMSIYSDMDIIIHDSAAINSIVHTDFSSCAELEKNKTLLTHCPDKYISPIPITFNDKQYVVSDKKIYELCESKQYSLNADYYIKMNNHFYAGFKKSSGKYGVVYKNNIADIIEINDENKNNSDIDIIELVEDIAGNYYHLNKINEEYFLFDKIPYHKKNLENGSFLFEKLENAGRI